MLGCHFGAVQLVGVHVAEIGGTRIRECPSRAGIRAVGFHNAKYQKCGLW